MSPIFISLRDTSYRLTGPARGVYFDLNSDGKAGEKIAWSEVSSDEALLALDRNGNGVIDSGQELFGDMTPQMPSKFPNGFSALAVYDDALNGGNEDGRIDQQDRIFGHLRLWLDDNHNGVSEPSEITHLSRHVKWISVKYSVSDRVDHHGNEFRYWADSELNDGTSRRIWDVFLQIRRD